MRKYILDKKYRIYSKSITKGTQEKYLRNNYYYKVNKLGNEGLVEYLVSEILKCSNLPNNEFGALAYIQGNLRILK